jgi:hypothetical protein
VRTLSQLITLLSAEDIKAVAGGGRRVIAKLAKADTALKAELYRSLGVHPTYLPKTNEIELVGAACRVCDRACRRGDVSTGDTRDDLRAV